MQTLGRRCIHQSSRHGDPPGSCRQGRSEASRKTSLVTSEWCRGVSGTYQHPLGRLQARKAQSSVHLCTSQLPPGKKGKYRWSDLPIRIQNTLTTKFESILLVIGWENQPTPTFPCGGYLIGPSSSPPMEISLVTVLSMSVTSNERKGEPLTADCVPLQPSSGVKHLK